MPKLCIGSFTECDLPIWPELLLLWTPLGGPYVEGNAEQYRWDVPQDPASLVALYGSDFVPLLEQFFKESMKDNSTRLVCIFRSLCQRDLIGFLVYSLTCGGGLETSLIFTFHCHSVICITVMRHSNRLSQTPYLFAYAGRPDLTQFWSRLALNEKYGTGPTGLCGNGACSHTVPSSRSIFH